MNAHRTAPNADQLPLHERLIANLWVRVYAASASPETILRMFRAEARRAIELANTLSEEDARRRVSIRRFPGIESGSRDWSVYMTLDHLVMINTGITALIHAICARHNHGVEICLDDIQPHQDVGADRIQSLEAMTERYTEVIERLGALRSRECHVHPWFGALNARQWHALAAIHNRIHRVQIEKIMRRLNRD